jgi:hypothetical protein
LLVGSILFIAVVDSCVSAEVAEMAAISSIVDSFVHDDSVVTVWRNASLARDPSESVIAVALEDSVVVTTRISLGASLVAVALVTERISLDSSTLACVTLVTAQISLNDDSMRAVEHDFMRAVEQ